MTTAYPFSATDVVIWLLVLLSVMILAIIEILGALGFDHFHTISYFASRIPVVRAVIALFFAGLFAWWLWHSSQVIAG